MDFYKEKYVPRDICNLLKGLEFHYPCIAYWLEGSTISMPTRTTGSTENWNKHTSPLRVSAPTYDQLAEWFRTQYNLEVAVKSWKNNTGIIYMYSVKQLGVPSTFKLENFTYDYYETFNLAFKEAIKTITP